MSGSNCTYLVHNKVDQACPHFFISRLYDSLEDSSECRFGIQNQRDDSMSNSIEFLMSGGKHLAQNIDNFGGVLGHCFTNPKSTHSKYANLRFWIFAKIKLRIDRVHDQVGEAEVLRDQLRNELLRSNVFIFCGGDDCFVAFW
eukprot:09577_1